MKFSNTTLVVFAMVGAAASPVSVNAQLQQQNKNNKTPMHSTPRLGGPRLARSDRPHRRRLETVFGSGNICPNLPAGGDVDGWVDILPPNDDDSVAINFPFDFEIYGKIFNMMYVNTNGNLSFEKSVEQFDALPLNRVRMVAPFWADVDIRAGNGDVYAKQIGTNTYAVAWDMVGYFDENSDKRNTFQVMISDGTNPTMGLGNNVCFCYGDMQWTTGDASFGIDGFGGIPAIVGLNEGDGRHFTLFGLYYKEKQVNTLDHFDSCFNVLVSVGANGDPHIKTWGGDVFDYMGECDLVLVHAPNFDGSGKDLDIHIRTTIQYDYSYIESAAIKIGDDVLEVSSYGNFAINGVDTPDNLLYEKEDNGVLGGYNVHHTEVNKKRHSFEILLGPNESITLSTHKHIVAVSINKGGTSKRYFGDSVGLMGSYDEGTLLARDGKTVMDDLNAFGQEWQVSVDEPKLFRDTNRHPQAPQQCLLPTPKAADERRRLGQSTISQEEAEQACDRYTGTKFENCVFDVIAFGDLEVVEDYN